MGRKKKITGQPLRQISHHARQVAARLQAGDTVEHLIVQHGMSAKSVHKAISDISALAPLLFAQIFGAAASGDRFLLDAGVASQLVLPVHKTLGSVSTVKCEIGDHAQDFEVYPAAETGGFRGLITWDGHMGLNTDLCTIASQAFSHGKGRALPGVIVLPAHTGQSLEILNRHAGDIADYLERHRQDPRKAGIWHYNTVTAGRVPA